MVHISEQLSALLGLLKLHRFRSLGVRLTLYSRSKVQEGHTGPKLMAETMSSVKRKVKDLRWVPEVCKLLPLHVLTMESGELQNDVPPSCKWWVTP